MVLHLCHAVLHLLDLGIDFRLQRHKGQPALDQAGRGADGRVDQPTQPFDRLAQRQKLGPFGQRAHGFVQPRQQVVSQPGQLVDLARVIRNRDL